MMAAEISDGLTEGQMECDVNVFQVLAKHPDSMLRAGQIVKLSEGKSILHQNYHIEDFRSKANCCRHSLRRLERAGLVANRKRGRNGRHGRKWGLAEGALGKGKA